MKMSDLIDQLAERKEAGYQYCSNTVRREIVESLLSDVNGGINLEQPLNRMTAEIVKAGDKWIIFSKEMISPSKIVVVGTRNKKVACHNLTTQFPEGLKALSRI